MSWLDRLLSVFRKDRPTVSIDLSPRSRNEEPLPDDEMVIEFEDGFSMNLAVTQVGPITYRLDNVPWSDEAGFRDVIEVEETGPQEARFVRIVEKSDWQVQSVGLSRAMQASKELDRYLEEVVELGGHWEQVFGGMLSVCLPPGVQHDLSDVRPAWEVRAYAADDLEDVLTTWEAASRLAHSFLDDEWHAKERKLIAETCLPKADTRVIELADGRVVGFLALIGNEVSGLFVHPDHHRNGMGEELIYHAEPLHDVLEVEVFAENQIGRSFFQATDFQPLSESLHEETDRKILRLRRSPTPSIEISP
ncbi:MAG: GNAT family N-acetyltransferase [Acidobacteriota bacterium]